MVLISPHEADKLQVGDLFVVVVFEVKKYIKVNALLNILKNLIVSAIFIATSYLFQRDSKKLFLDPMKEMIVFIKQMKEDPIKASINFEQF